MTSPSMIWGSSSISEVDEVDIPAGETEVVTFPDGSKVSIKAIHDTYDPTDRYSAMRAIHETMQKGEFLTGLLYINPQHAPLPEVLNLVDEPLVSLPESVVKPGPEVLAAIMETLK